MTTRAQRIEAKIRNNLAPVALSVIDESHRHAGHAGARPEGETHFRLVVVSDRFASLSRLQRQRLVNELMADEFASGLHALALDLKAVAEA